MKKKVKLNGKGLKLSDWDRIIALMYSSQYSYDLEKMYDVFDKTQDVNKYELARKDFCKKYGLIDIITPEWFFKNEIKLSTEAKLSDRFFFENEFIERVIPAEKSIVAKSTFTINNKGVSIVLLLNHSPNLRNGKYLTCQSHC